MMHAPTKITLKNQTKMTLNSRFTAIMKARPPMQAATMSRTSLNQQRPASEKNRRLAQQMEKRTYNSGHSSMGDPHHHYNRSPATSKPSVLERLGQRRGGVTPHVSVSRGGRGFGSRTGSMRGNIQKPYASRGSFGNSRYNGRGRGGGQMRGRGRGGGAAAASNKFNNFKPVSKNDLDNDLDSYMSKKGAASGDGDQ